MSTPVALVTGTSSGFGLVTSIDLARAGFRVVATMRNLDRREALEREAEQAGVSLDIQVLDVTDDDTVVRCREHVEATYGRLDVLVNNAGYGLAGALEDVGIDALRAQLETNLVGPVRTTQAFLPMMRRRRSGRIINVSSVGGRVSFPLFGAYHASKWGLEGLSEAWSYELAPFGIAVVIVEPGAHRTEFDRGSLVRATPDGSPYASIVSALESRQESMARLMAPAGNVSRTIVRAATARRPRLRYRVGVDTHAVLALRGLLPDRLFRWAVARLVGVPKTLTA